MLNEMEQRALEMLLAGEDARLAVLRAQLNKAVVTHRELSGVGFFTYLSVPTHLPRMRGSPRLVIGDVEADVEGLKHPAGFLLFVIEGALSLLECFIVDDRWPETATLRRAYYVHPPARGKRSLVETKERDLAWALGDTR